MNELKTYEVKFSQGFNTYRATITDKSSQPPQHTIFESPKVLDMHESKDRRFALDCFFNGLRDLLRQRTFPKDALIYDTKTTVNGKTFINPRYPDENNKGN